MKRILALLLSVLMLSAFIVGCGDNKNKGNDDGKEKLKIGGIGPVTGDAAMYGVAVKNAAELAIKEINKAGGVNGMELELNFQDDEHNAEKAVNAYNTLVDWGMQALIGTVTSTPCIAVAAETHKDNMFQLTPSGSAIECTKYPNTFRVCFNDPDQGIASAQYIADNNLAKKVAVIYDSSDVYSSGIYKKFAEESKVKGLEIVADEAFTADNATDFSVQIQKVQESGAELLFLPIYYKEAALILTQADKIGLDIKVFGCDGLDGLMEQLGDNTALAEDVMLLTPFAPDAEDEETQNFVKAYRESYSEESLNQFAADAYDAVYAIKLALEKENIDNVNIDHSDLCEKLKKAFVEIELVGVTGTITWSADGEPTKEPKAMIIKEGKYKAM